MSWKSFACVAALSALITSPALAVPSLQWVDNGGSVTLQVTPSGIGSIAIELAAEFDGGAIDAASVFDEGVTWENDNPGDNPFTLGVTEGLYTTDLASGDVFASYGSNIFASTAAVDFLTLDYSSAGTFSVSSLVIAEDGLLIDPTPIVSDISVTVLPSFVLGDADDSGVVNNLDIEPFARALTNPGAYQADFPGVVFPDQIDTNMDGSFNNLDILSFATILTGGATATAVPEPSSALLLASVAFAGLVARRK